MKELGFGQPHGCSSGVGVGGLSPPPQPPCLAAQSLPLWAWLIPQGPQEAPPRAPLGLVAPSSSRASPAASAVEMLRGTFPSSLASPRGRTGKVEPDVARGAGRCPEPLRKASLLVCLHCQQGQGRCQEGPDSRL